MAMRMQSPGSPSPMAIPLARRRGGLSAKASPARRKPCGSCAVMRQMADFAWRAIDTGGRERQGRIHAATPDEARARLEARRFYVVAVDKAGDGPGPSLAASLI